MKQTGRQSSKQYSCRRKAAVREHMLAAEGGLHEARISRSGRASINAERFRVDFQNFRKLDETVHRRLLRQASQQVAVVFKNVGPGLGETFGLPRGRRLRLIDRRNGAHNFTPLFRREIGQLVFVFRDGHGGRLPHPGRNSNGQILGREGSSARHISNT